MQETSLLLALHCVWSIGNETFNKMVVQKLGNWGKIEENELNSLTAKLDFGKGMEANLFCSSPLDI